MMPWIFIYSLLYWPLIFLAYLFSFFNKKIQQGFSLRKKQDGVHPWLNTPAGQKPLWFHCASGEFEYAKPVIRLLKQKHPEVKILVTFFSPSVVPSLSACKEVDFFCPTPWDTSSHWKHFLEHHQPQALLIARTDLWPMMIRKSEKAKIPCLLFSKTVNANKQGLESWLSYQLMKRLSDVFCATEDDRKSLADKLTPFQKVHNAGDTRYDQCLYRLQHGRPLKPLNNFLRPIFVAGSTWPSDEKVLIPVIQHFSREISFVLAPHEPTKQHLLELEKQLDQMQIQHQRYSETNSWNPDAVLIVDQVGILADLYQWGRFAWVGGSMDRSVHSVMEPLAQGLLTFVGPKHSNNREALTFKTMTIEGCAPVQETKNSHELFERLQKGLESWTEQKQFALRLAVRKKAGASEIVVRWVENQSLNL